MKIKDIAADIAVTVGCFVGVGFLSGKETQTFVGNIVNAIIFAATFFAANYAVRNYCGLNRCGDAALLSRSLWGKRAAIFDAALCVSCFVCIVTVLAGVQQCLDRFVTPGRLPLYAIVAAAIGVFILTNGMSALTKANTVCIVAATVLVIAIYFTRNQSAEVAPPQPTPSPLKSVIYALFSVTTSVGVLTQLSAKRSAQYNLTCSAGAAATLLLITLAILPLCKRAGDLPALDGIDNIYLKVYAMITLLLCGVTGTVANAYPLVKQLYPVIPDKTLCALCIYLAAVAFSMFGFDFAVKAGYTCVGVLGAVTVAAIVCKNLQSRLRNNTKGRTKLMCARNHKSARKAK